jgi:hypothetical protein
MGEVVAMAIASLSAENDRYALEAMRLRSQVARELTSEPERKLAKLFEEAICAPMSHRRTRRFRVG